MWSRRTWRLGSGLILFAYISTHLLNHSLGLISLEMAEAGLRIVTVVWHSAPGTAALYGAAAIHVGLAFMSLYERPLLHLRPIEWIRITLGFSMPTLLIGHAVLTRVAFELYGHPAEYARVIWTLWTSGTQGRQLALLAPGWGHGCIGLYLAFRTRPAFRRGRYVLLGVALVLPLLAAFGFLSMQQRISALSASPGWSQTRHVIAPPAEQATVTRLRDDALSVYLGAIAAVLAARILRRGALLMRAGKSRE